MNDIIKFLLSGAPISNKINFLKNKTINVPAWENLVKRYDPQKHFILSDDEGRRDKKRKDGRIEKACRLTIGLEKLAVKRLTQFTFAIPVKRTYKNIDDNPVRKEIAKAIEAIFKYVRIDAENKKRGEMYYASCEALSVWDLIEYPNTLYGFKSEYKLKVRSLSPKNGFQLYPLFDKTGDMIAMSFQYDYTEGNKTTTYFECYTKDNHFIWVLNNSEWEPINDEIRIGKIPCAYIWRDEEVYTKNMSGFREEIEYTLSRNSDTISYNSSPILKVAGAVEGEEEKGETQRVFRVENGGDVSIVSWSQANEAIKYQVAKNESLFWSEAQLPDISFENMKSLGNIGYDARKTLLTDAHLRIGDEATAWIEMFERETNIVKAFLKQMNKKWEDEIDNVEVEHEITPFIQDDENTFISIIQKANGGKPIMSQLDSIRRAGYSDDAEKTLDQIQKEEMQGQVQNLFNSAI